MFDTRSSSTFPLGFLVFSAATLFLDELTTPGHGPHVAHAQAPLNPKGSGSKSATSFSKTLSDSLKDLHSETRSSTFATTLLGGSITLEQWKSHMMQRALILRALDTEFKEHGDNPFVKALYGKNEQESLALLEKDLAALGIQTLEAPLPASQKLLDYIAQHSKPGAAQSIESTPWELLGIHNIINGGTQSGGKWFIGPAAATCLKVSSLHYQQSTGLAEYRKELDKVEEPQAQQAISKGARDGYRLLIDLNNDVRFKPVK